jgi:hypothetical protein
MAGLALIALVPASGCKGFFGGPAGTPEGIIRASLKPFDPPVYAPVTGATPVPFVPDPVSIAKNPASGKLVDLATNTVLRGTTSALPGESPVPLSDPNVVATTVDGKRVSYIDAGETLLMETSHLAPNKLYNALLTWPNGLVTERDFTSNGEGVISQQQNNAELYPHIGFYRLKVQHNSPSISTGVFKIDIKQPKLPIEQTLYFRVRPRPVVFVTDADSTDIIHFFYDKPAQLFLHAEGLRPNQKLSAWVIKQRVGYTHPLKDGLTLDDKVFANLANVEYRANDKGVIHQELLSWNQRDAIVGSYVVVGKVLNSLHVYKASEDLGITDHQTFTINASGGAVAPPVPTAPPPTL